LNTLNNLICRRQSKHKLAAEAIHIEQNILKESVGSQDQIAASFGGLNQIIFRPNEEFEVLPIKLDSNKKSSFEDHIQLFFTGLTRESSQIQKGHIKNIPKLAHELRLLTEQVNIASNILKNSINPIPEIGRLLNDQWQIKRTLNNAVTNLGIDRAYEIGLKSGAIGGKLLGAGGGGFLLFITEPNKHKSVVNSLPGLMNIPIKFDSTGSQIIYKPKE
jgi:D-glycero-alpha-D-manno-heptose-7-phosphate kinase